MRRHNWAASPLGDPGGWPQPLKVVAGIMLAANQPMFAVWGPEQAMIYNDAYSHILGGHHPSAVGRPFFEAWPELVDSVGPIVARCYGGEPTYMDDIELVLHRKGYAEEAHFSFFYAPVHDEAGRVGGFFCACTETTEQVRSNASSARPRPATVRSSTARSITPLSRPTSTARSPAGTKVPGGYSAGARRRCSGGPSD